MQLLVVSDGGSAASYIFFVSSRPQRGFRMEGSNCRGTLTRAAQHQVRVNYPLSQVGRGIKGEGRFVG